MTQINRRHVLFTATALVGFSALGAPLAFAAPDPEAAFANDPIRKTTDAQWKAKLGGGLAYTVLRQEDTEAPFTNALLNEHRAGVFHCKGCDLPLFESKWKYDSHTGWPSFFDVIKQNISNKVDHKLAFETRSEYHCARCLGHQGHVFDDGPQPTGLRYCNNGASITFKPAVA
jgi:peptide-methionine (R)-S-oxide reductase